MGGRAADNSGMVLLLCVTTSVYILIVIFMTMSACWMEKDFDTEMSFKKYLLTYLLIDRLIYHMSSNNKELGQRGVCERAAVECPVSSGNTLLGFA